MRTPAVPNTADIEDALRRRDRLFSMTKEMERCGAAGSVGPNDEFRDEFIGERVEVVAVEDGLRSST